MNYALIFAGGVGSRMNSKARPKQFLAFGKDNRYYNNYERKL